MERHVSDFVDAMCDQDQGAVISKPDLYDAYTMWCLAEGVDHPLSAPQFSRVLERVVSITPTRMGPHQTGRRAYRGLQLLRF